MPGFKPIFQVLGVLLAILAAAMLIPGLIGYILGNEDTKAFVFSAALTAFVGSSLFITSRGDVGEMNLRQMFIFTTATWSILPAFAALPLYLADFGLTFLDAYFEAVSGMTTTGSTVIVGLDRVTPELLLWRSLLQWLGGIGIIVFAIAILPMLRIGGMQLFRTESSEKIDKVLPRAAQVAKAIALVYALLTAACAICLWMAGMSGLDAICHAMCTVSTAGFSTYDASIGHFNSWKIEFVTMIFMITGALPFLLVFQALRGKPFDLIHNSQVRWFICTLLVAILIMTFWLTWKEYYSFAEALRHTSFNLVSIITTTGYSSGDYGSWGPFAIVFFFMAMAVGGCTGSSSGGIKIFRFQVLHETAKSQVHQLIQPHGVFLPKYNGRPISESITSSVMGFFILFALSFTVLALLLSLTGLNYITSMSAAISALSNVGPGLGAIIGPAGNHAPLPDLAKLLICFGMIAGRLELFTVLVLFAPKFWSD